MTGRSEGPVPVRASGEPVEGRTGTHGRLRFGPFEFDTATLELRRDGTGIPLAPQPARLLALLASRQGEMVSREEIREHVWGTLAVEFDSGLHTCVRHVRSALEDEAQRPQYIETIPRRGYRFIANVEEVVDIENGLQARPLLRLAFVATAAVLVVLGLFAVQLVERRDAASVAGPPPRLVVLPFASLTADEQPYLAEGLADEIRTDLARIGPDRLRVIARVSSERYRDAEMSMAQIVDDLGVTHLLEGSVRSAPSGLVLSARLVRTDDETQVWAGRFDIPAEASADPVFEIASRVSAALALEFDPAHRQRGAPVPAEARDALLEAKYLYYDHQPDAAEPRVRKAVELAPDYAEAHGLLAELLQSTSRGAEAEQYAERSIDLDPMLSRGHRVLGHVALERLDGVAAGRWYEEAVRVAPADPESRVAYGFWLVIAQRPDEGITQFQRALESDPVSPLVHGDLPWSYFYAHRLDEAEAYAARGLELMPDLLSSRSCRVWLEIVRGNTAAAKTRLRELMIGSGLGEEDLARLDALSGAESVQAYLRRMLELRQAREPRSHSGLAAVHALLGDTTAALRELELSLMEREPNVVYFPIDPRFDSVREAPEFSALRERLASLLWSRPSRSSGRGAEIGRAGPETRRPVVNATRLHSQRPTK